MPSRSLAESFELSSRSPEILQILRVGPKLSGRVLSFTRGRRSTKVAHWGSFVDEPPAEKGGRTALQAAAENGHLSIVRMFLDSGASANEDPAPENGFTSLHAASSAGCIGVVMMLIVAGADVNASPCRLDGRTSFQAASSAGHLEIIRRLVQNGVYIEALCCRP
jgi:hypothetical protein